MKCRCGSAQHLVSWCAEIRNRDVVGAGVFAGCAITGEAGTRVDIESSVLLLRDGEVVARGVEASRREFAQSGAPEGEG